MTIDAEQEAVSILERWSRAMASLEEINADRAQICREAKSLGIDVDCMKNGSIVWREGRPSKKEAVKRCPSRVFQDLNMIVRASSSRYERMPTFIYFGVNVLANTLKVGISSSPTKRLYSLTRMPGVKLVLWASFPGDRQDEIECHKALIAYQVLGEWFRVTPASIAISERLLSERIGDVPPIPEPVHAPGVARSKLCGAAS